MIGQQLGNYRLVELLGHGGFAEVYLGQHIRISKQAAIKVLHAHLSDEQTKGFEQEAKTIASLEHSHIVRILDFDVINGIPFLVMDYYSDGTLRKRHLKGNRVPLPTVVSYIKQVADALQYAHDHKIIHRDVKPENMLIGRNGDLLLSDFGIAVTAHSTHSMRTQDFAGTAAYMAPEQIEQHPRRESDQYALAVVAYEWLTGSLPFVGTPQEIVIKHLTVEPPSLCLKAPHLSKAMEEVVMKALAKESKERFASVQTFATALEQASQSGQSQPLVLLELVTSPNQSEQSQPSVSLPEAMQSKQSSSPTILAAPPHLSSQPTREVLSQSHPSHASEVSGTPLLIPQTTSHPSRRTVIGGLVGLTLVSGGITWFTLLQNSTPKPPPHIAPTPLPMGTLPYTYKGHSDWVWAVAWSPDGKHIASGSVDKTVQIWDTVNGGHVLTYQGHSNTARAVAWSPDSKHIASGSEDKTVQIWDAVDGDHVFTYQGHSDAVTAVAWSPDGKRLASASYDKTVQVWDAMDGGHAFIYQGHSDIVWTVAWSPDGKRIASGSTDKTVQVWNVLDGGNIFTYQGHSNTVFAVAWSPDGKRLASGSWDHTVQVWDAVDGHHVFTYQGHSDIVRAVAWSPDGTRLASGSDDKTVQVWDAVDGHHVFTYQGHSRSVNEIAWSSDSKYIASGSDDKTVQIWMAS